MRILNTAFVAIFLFACAPALSAESVEDCSLQRQVVSENGQLFYIVGARAQTLYMISRDLYGYPQSWKLLAKWNNLNSPYTLKSGQRLELKVPPTISASDANTTLAHAWASLGKTKMVDWIVTQVVSHELGCKVRVPPTSVPAVVAPVPEAAAVAEPVSEAAPAAVPEPTATPSPQVTEEPVPAKKRWGFHPSLLGSVFELEGKDLATNVENKISSKVNYGAELGVSYKASDSTRLFVGASIEHIEFETPSSGSISMSKNEFLDFNLRVDQQIAEPFIIYLSANYAERPFESGSPLGTTVDAVYVPELSLGGKLSLFSVANTRLWLVADGLYSFAKTDVTPSLKEASGYHAGLLMTSSAFNVSILYRELDEKTETSNNTQRGAALKIGMDF